MRHAQLDPGVDDALSAVDTETEARILQHLRQARDSLSHSLQVILGTMIGSAEAAGPGRAAPGRRGRRRPAWPRPARPTR